MKNNIAAIAFSSDLVDETRGVTAKNFFVNKLFASSVNKHNLQLMDNTKTNPHAGLGGAIRLTGDAESWLKFNLNINVHDLQYQDVPQKGGRRLMSAHPRNNSTRHEETRRKSWALP